MRSCALPRVGRPRLQAAVSLAQGPRSTWHVGQPPFLEHHRAVGHPLYRLEVVRRDDDNRASGTELA